MRPTRILISLATLGLIAAAFVGGGATAGRIRSDGAARTGLRPQVLRLLQAHYYRRVDARAVDGRPLSKLSVVLGDPYTQVLSRAAVAKRDQNEAGRYGGIGVQLAPARRGVRVDAVRPSGPAARAGIRPGDVVVAVGTASATAHRANAVAAQVRGRVGSRIRIRVRRGNRVDDFSLVRSELPLTLVRARMTGRTGVIALTEFADGAGAKVRAAVGGLVRNGARRLVLDLRGNPGGYVRQAVEVASAFLPRGTVVVRESGLHLRPVALRTHARPVAPALPLVVLVNGESASAAEIVAGCLRDHGRARLVGSRTFGKGVVQDVLPLPGQRELKLTIAEDRTPAGTVIHGRGLRPDVFAADDRHTTGDDVLTAAVRVLEHHQAA